MSLFLKIFLWFWFAMAAVGAALVISLYWIPAGEAKEWQAAATETLQLYGQDAAQTYETGGARALAQYLATVNRASGLRTILINDRGVELTRNLDLPMAARLARRVLESGTEETVNGPRQIVIAIPITGPSGAHYVIVGMAPRRLVRGETSPVGLALRVAVVLATGGLVCYLLARYLTSPVFAIRSAARRLAQGNLRTRVAPTVGRRTDELADLARDFDLMAERLQEMVESQRRLLGDISHELRSPLSRLNVAAALARKSAGEAATTHLDRIQLETDRMNQLIGQLLTLARLESRASELPKDPVPLDELLAGVVADADFEAGGRKRAVRVVETAPCQIRGSADLLRSAIENVARNAIRHTPEESDVEVSLRCSGSGAGREAIIEIRDHGPGVPSQDLENIFRPFFRVDAARDRQSGGTGLGLAIAARAITLHDGKISAHNAPGGGLLVEIRLPVGN
jgi:two-component system sensor histidine kinase CpxA